MSPSLLDHSILAVHGFSPIAFENGVYHLRRKLAPHAEAVGVLFSVEPIKLGAETILKLFLYEVGPGDPVNRIIVHWQNLDARRLEESGIYPIVFTVGSDFTPTDGVTSKTYTRPDGRVRHAVQLTSGEVICYN